MLRLLAANRNPDSFVVGATVLHQAPDSSRRSEDVDVFCDQPEALLAAYEADTEALQQAGFEVEPVGRVQPEFRRAIVRRGGRQTKIEWVQDAASRFFPVEPDLELGWRLHFWDAATNKVLAMAGRQKMRDFLDCLYLHQHRLHLGALAWAAGQGSRPDAGIHSRLGHAREPVLPRRLGRRAVGQTHRPRRHQTGVVGRGA